LAQAALWFESSIRDWALQSTSPRNRLDLLHFAVENRVKVVSIFLDAKDDPQVIFEALNHRGVRLDAADLVKNLLFQLLEKQGDRDLEEKLLHDHWAMLDNASWREQITTGRIKRVRVDVLLAYWLSSQRGEETSVEHLFRDFKRWMHASESRAADVVRSIRTYADTMDKLLSLPMTAPVAQVIDRLDATSTTTPWPLLLFLYSEAEIPERQAEKGALAIDSFLMRRAICRMTTKDYNRLFNALLRTVKESDPTTAGDALSSGLASQDADSRLWPTDAQFAKGLVNSNLYREVVRARLRTLLVGVENSLASTKSEASIPHRSAEKHLTIEHVMPVKWEQHWGIPDGSSDELLEARVNAIHSLGNLTLATQSLNSTLSNARWSMKRHTFQTHSLARVTTASILTSPEGAIGWDQASWTKTWDEERIRIRGLWLVSIALETWPRPRASPELKPGVTSPDNQDVDKSERIHAPSLGTASRSSGERTEHQIQGDLLPLLKANLVVPGDRLRHVKISTGTIYEATVNSSGGLTTKLGQYQAPSPALNALVGSSRNGWKDWLHVSTGKTLGELRTLLE
jgi:hypothetical protein